MSVSARRERLEGSRGCRAGAARFNQRAGHALWTLTRPLPLLTTQPQQPACSCRQRHVRHELLHTRPAVYQRRVLQVRVRSHGVVAGTPAGGAFFHAPATACVPYSAPSPTLHCPMLDHAALAACPVDQPAAQPPRHASAGNAMQWCVPNCTCCNCMLKPASTTPSAKLSCTLAPTSVNPSHPLRAGEHAVWRQCVHSSAVLCFQWRGVLVRGGWAVG